MKWKVSEERRRGGGESTLRVCGTQCRAVLYTYIYILYIYSTVWGIAGVLGCRDEGLQSRVQGVCATTRRRRPHSPCPRRVYPRFQGPRLFEFTFVLPLVGGDIQTPPPPPPPPPALLQNSLSLHILLSLYIYIYIYDVLNGIRPGAAPSYISPWHPNIFWDIFYLNIPMTR